MWKLRACGAVAADAPGPARRPRVLTFLHICSLCSPLSTLALILPSRFFFVPPDAWEKKPLRERTRAKLAPRF